ncbi:hypothetical protein [uncultured Shewanella sp.]|uniref:hypothetical protein n=1 Tax=uncultured Shewanella sp. TaxID=173975 RepID=UPI002613E9E1|nr:hypothetical protein [uncultured Shewanella sp.]
MTVKRDGQHTLRLWMIMLVGLSLQACMLFPRPGGGGPGPGPAPRLASGPASGPETSARLMPKQSKLADIRYLPYQAEYFYIHSDNRVPLVLAVK